VRHEADGKVRDSLVVVPPSLSVAPTTVVLEAIKHLNEWLARQEQDKPDWNHGELR
jgi:hypothetical protein